MNKRLLAEGPGYREWFHYDLNGAKHAEERTWGIETEFDTPTAELEASKALQNDPDHWKNGVKNDLVHYAHIPDAVLVKWHALGVDINDPRECIKMVNRPEWRYLKCVDKVHLG